MPIRNRVRFNCYKTVADDSYYCSDILVGFFLIKFVCNIQKTHIKYAELFSEYILTLKPFHGDTIVVLKQNLTIMLILFFKSVNGGIEL